MTARRGLTLVEVLAAVALLTLLATAAVPILRAAGRSLAPPPRVDPVELSLLADLAAGEAARVAEESTEITWDEYLDESGDADRPPVTVRTLTQPESDEGGAWIAFSCDGRHVFRWIRVEPDEEAP